MGRRKREPMSEGKKNIIGMLLEEYDIRSAKDIEDALKDLLGGTIQEMLEAEMDEHLGYSSYERSDNSNYRNGRKTKKIRGNLGETEIEVPQDRDGTFEPKVVKKRQKDISGIEQKIISLYAKGMTTRQISDTIEDIYGFEVSDGMVSDITDRLLPQIEDWQNRPLDEVYPIVFIDAVHFSVRDNGQIRKLAAYVILAVNLTGHKEVLSIHIGENESAKYWLGSIILTMLRPSTQTFLPYLTAELIICCTLSTLDANVAMIILLFLLSLNIFSNVAPTVFSDIVKPGLKALVLSHISASTPFFPSSPSL